MKMQDLSLARFGRLEALAPLRRRDGRGRSTIDWRCRCDCGNECIVAGGSLRSGLTRSCGCLLAESRKSAGTKHGAAGTRLYIIWLNMRVRCSDPTYLHYCGRGISVCARWQSSFEDFRQDVGEPPSAKHTLDRKDNDGNYEPGNVRWATASQQGRNKRQTIYLEINGERIALADAAERYGIPYDTLHRRIKNMKLPPEEAIRWRKMDGTPVFASRDR